MQSQEVVTLSVLPAPQLELPASRHYYLSDVIDSRPVKGKRLGNVIEYTVNKPLQATQNLEGEVYSYWKQALPHRGPQAVPVVARINALGFTESRVAPGKVKGEAKINIDFLWYRDNEPVPLTSYQAKSEYTRPDSKQVYQDFFGKMLGNALVYFDKWMGINNGKNPALVRGVRLVVEDEDLPAKEDTVFYHPDRPLNYSDFKAAPKPGRYAAMVFTSISYEGSSRVKDNYLEVVIKPRVYLVKSMSWMRPESKNPNVLKHEQLHFDIAKIAAERFKKQLQKIKISFDDHDSQIQYQFLETYREMHKLQELYDKETRHGLNPDAQQRWEVMVKNELAGKSSIELYSVP